MFTWIDQCHTLGYLKGIRSISSSAKIVSQGTRGTSAFCKAFFSEQGLVKLQLYPKLHLLHEAWEQMVYESTQSDWIYNPIAETCSVDEDFVGRCAVLSRSVSPRLNSLRSLQRYLAQIQQSWPGWKNMIGSGCGCLRMVVLLKLVCGPWALWG